MVPGNDFIGAAADHAVRIGSPRIGLGFDELPGDGIIAVERRQVEEIRCRFLQADDQGPVIDGFDADGIGRGLLIEIVFGLVDTKEHIGIFRSYVGIDDALPGIFDVACRNRRAVAPFDARPQVEGIRLAIR